MATSSPLPMTISLMTYHSYINCELYWRHVKWIPCPTASKQRTVANVVNNQ